MKKITMPVEKTAVQELSGEQLDMLVRFGKSEEFKLISQLADREKYKRYQTDFLIAKSMEDVNLMRGINVGMDFMIDAVQRAKEELKNRVASEDEVDNEDDLK